MKNTKKNILESARVLFNKDGVADSTLRKIAAHLGISQGNLNYYFKKREDILEALYFEMVQDFDDRVKRTVNEKMSLELIYHESKLSMLRMFAYRFIWQDLHQIVRENTKIKTHFLNAGIKRRAGLNYAINILRENKIVKDESYQGQYEHTIEKLINYSDTWISSIDMYKSKIKEIDIEQKHIVYFSIFYPLLTKRGQKIFDTLLN